MANKQLSLPANRLLNNSNLVTPGGTAQLYLSGTLTPAQFLDPDGTTLGHILTANGLGQLPNGYQDETIPFRLILKDRNGVELDGGDIDPFYFGMVAGVDGSPASVQIGTVTTGAAGSDAEASNSGTAQNVVLDFAIPRGVQGIPGTAATVAVGVVTTGAAGSAAAVVNAGTANAALFDFTIPKGDQGIQGNAGPQGPAGDVAKAADRTALAAVAATSGLVRALAESGREGLFVFDDSDLSAEIAADTAQGLYVPPASDATGASGAWVRKFHGPPDARWFGVPSDGVTDAKAALETAAAIVSALGLDLSLGNATYNIASTLTLDEDNLRIHGHNAKITSGITTTDPLILLSGDGVEVRGLKTVMTAPVTTAHHYRCTGTDFVVVDFDMSYSTDQNTPSFYIRQEGGKSGGRVSNGRVRGANAFMGFCQGSDLEISHIDAKAAAGGDDFLALKAIDQPSVNIRVFGCRIEGFATMLSIGSNVGMNLADDPTRSRYVANVDFTGNVGVACGGMLTIRPGGTTGQDYRDGLVESVNFSDNVMRDPTGAKAAHLLHITPGQRAVVRDIKGSNNLFIGRMNVASQFGLYVFSGTGDKPTVDDFDIELACFDPFAGAANGALITAAGALGADPVEGYDVGDAVPGYPMESLTNIDPTAVTCSRINIRMSADGTSVNGVSMDAGGDDALSIEKLRLANFNATNNANAAGVRTLSRIRMTGDAITIGTSSKIHASTNKAYRCEDGSSGAIICNKVDTIHFAESVAAGTDKKKTVWAAGRNAYVAKVEILSASAVPKVDNVNYTRFGVYDPDNGNSLIASINTSLTGVAVTADTFTKIVQGSDLSAADQARIHFTRDQRLQVEKNDFGTGNAIADVLVRVHWAPYG